MPNKIQIYFIRVFSLIIDAMVKGSSSSNRIKAATGAAVFLAADASAIQGGGLRGSAAATDKNEVTVTVAAAYLSSSKHGDEPPVDMTMSEKIIAETAPFQMISQKWVLENKKDKVKKEQKKTKDKQRALADDGSDSDADGKDKKSKDKKKEEKSKASTSPTQAPSVKPTSSPSKFKKRKVRDRERENWRQTTLIWMNLRDRKWFSWMKLGN